MTMLDQLYNSYYFLAMMVLAPFAMVGFLLVAKHCFKELALKGERRALP